MQAEYTARVNAIPVDELSVTDILNPLRRVRRAELLRLAQLSPFESLPRCLFADPSKRLQPPTLYYGWLIDVEDFRTRGVARRLASTHIHEPATPRVVPDNPIRDLSNIGLDYGFDECAEMDPVVKQEAAQAAEDFDLCVDVAEFTLDNLGFALPATYANVTAVVAQNADDASGFIRLGFVLYSNYHPEDALSVEDTRRVQEALGFKGEPGWFMDATETTWWYGD